MPTGSQARMHAMFTTCWGFVMTAVVMIVAASERLRPVTTSLPLTRARYLDAITADAAAISRAARSGLDRDVTSCPGWDLARLVAHTGRVHRMATVAVAEQLSDRPTAAQNPAPPDDPSVLVAWFDDGASRLVDTLRTVELDSPAWNFIGQNQTAAFWVRRQAHETSIHRWDAQTAVGSPEPIAADLAVDGVDEVLLLLGARLPMTAPHAALGGSLHLHATDADGEWMVRVVDGAMSVEHGHGKGDAAVRGTASQLLLGLWGRVDLSADDSFERFGDTAVVSAMRDLAGF